MLKAERGNCKIIECAALITNPRWTAQRSILLSPAGLRDFLADGDASLHLPGEHPSLPEDPVQMAPQIKALALPNPS